jgi:ATP-binding cassette, subfamily G (WHITE), member 2, SNQ2
MSTILSTPLAQGLMVPFCYLRSIYEIRERSSKTYSWAAMITANLLVEVPWNMLGTCIFFFCWYWTVGFESSRAGYMVSFLNSLNCLSSMLKVSDIQFLLFVVVYPIYYTTIGQVRRSILNQHRRVPSLMSPDTGGRGHISQCLHRLFALLCRLQFRHCLVSDLRGLW